MVSIPESVTSVKIKNVPGWTVSTTLRPLAVPVTNEAGGEINTTVSTVTW